MIAWEAAPERLHQADDSLAGALAATLRAYAGSKPRLSRPVKHADDTNAVDREFDHRFPVGIARLHAPPHRYRFPYTVTFKHP